MAAEDLEARVARLERVLLDAATALGGSHRTSTASAGGTPTPPTAKAVRTLVQLFVAAVPALGLGAALDRPEVALVLTLALAPVVTWLQNTLEDHRRIGALLRDLGDPSALSPAGEDLAP